MEINIKKVLIDKINKSEWWHVTPCDSEAYKKRGKFLTSTYQQAEFYGRPNDTPYRVSIKNPIYGFSEIEILKKLFPDKYKERIFLDAVMFRKAKSLGYDAIVLFGTRGEKYLQMNRKPPSIELNLLYP